METYAAFLERVSQFEQAELSIPEQEFLPNPSIKAKVKADNTFSNFYGDTVVFDLDDGVKAYLAEVVDTLYRTAPTCFAEKLPTSSFHMTLHDLSSGSQLPQLLDELIVNRKRLEEKLVKTPLTPMVIRMRSHFLFNMVDTSLVLGLIPASRADYDRLMELYTLVDDVKKLPYPFTPHITLAYYNREGFSAEQVRDLKQVVRELNHAPIELELDTRRLYYQTFSSMKDYQSIFSLLKNEGACHE